jgi:hypothetical protein
MLTAEWIKCNIMRPHKQEKNQDKFVCYKTYFYLCGVKKT